MNIKAMLTISKRHDRHRSPRLFERWRRSDNASAGIIFGISAIPTFAFLAFAIDYGGALHAKSKLDAAADAASMAAITTAKNVITNASTSGSSVTDSAIAAGTTQAQAAFRANAGAVAFASVPVPTVQLTRVNQTLTATVQYSTQSVNNLIPMMGLNTMPLAGVSTSTLTMPTYINYYIVVDSSQSMGVASTADDEQSLYDRIVTYKNWLDPNNQIGCVFGCHVKGTQLNGDGSVRYTQPYTNEYLAHNVSPYINLRIDAARSAIKSIVQDAFNVNPTPSTSLVRIGIYTMQQDPITTGSYIQNIVSPPSANFATMMATGGPIDQLDLGNNNGGGQGDTGFANSLNYFAGNILTTQGDGSTQTTALNYVFIVTDGLKDVPCGDRCHVTGAFDDALCTQLKSKATVGVIYTTYNPIYNNNKPSNGLQGDYSSLVAPYANTIPANLKTCSSDPTQYYYEASDGPAIQTAMAALFKPTIQAARLSR